MRDFDENGFPIAYLITFRCYGTWLHGDHRGSIDRKHNVYGTLKLSPNTSLERSDSDQRKHTFNSFNSQQRSVVEKAIRAVCENHKYLLRAINVRTNHVHTVISAPCNPEHVLNALKSYSTRALRLAGLVSGDVRPWARHGSTVYLWKDEDVSRACGYVALEQGDEFKC